MATLTADRPYVQRSLLDPHEEDHAPRWSEGAHDARPPEADRDVPPPQPHAPEREPRSVPRPDAGTLDDVVTATWRRLTVTHTAACLVCGGEVRPRWSSGPHPVGGVCAECGAEIA